jgi:hypothetical protein
MQTYGHYEFEDLVKDEANFKCFDCSKSPAHWASVNNAVYLCLNCAGEHRGFGVSVSYVRSITIDTWNDNQINMMKFGGNRNLQELIDVYQVDMKKVNKTSLYNSRLLDFYRKHLKAKVNGEKFEKEPPAKDEAMKGLGGDTYTSSNDASKYVQIKSSTKKDEKVKSVTSDDPETEVDSGFIGGLNNWMSKAINSTKFIASKVGDMEIGNKIINTGSVVAETGSNIVTKGVEASVSH